jgi:hypothetical protein
MKTIPSLFACALFLSFASAAQSAELRPLSFTDMLRAMNSRGNPTLPSAWAGVWDFDDADYDCGTNEFLGSDPSVDTLCTGDTFQEEGKLDCSGTASDTEIDIACTGSSEIFPGCNVTSTFTLQATRSGETLTAVATFSFDFEPDDCAFQEDSCIRTETTGTRIAPEPAECSTPVEPNTWGRVKAAYR